MVNDYVGFNFLAGIEKVPLRRPFLVLKIVLEPFLELVLTKLEGDIDDRLCLKIFFRKPLRDL